MLPRQVTLLRMVSPSNSPPLLPPVEVGIDQTLPHIASYLLLDARLAVFEAEVWQLIRECLRESFSPTPQLERLPSQAMLSRSCALHLVTARVALWHFQGFRIGGCPLGLAWCFASSCLSTRFKRQSSAYCSIAPQSRVLSEDVALDDTIFAARAALDDYDGALTRYMERLEAYIAYLSPSRKPSLSFKSVEALSHTIQRLFQALDALLAQPAAWRQQAVSDLAAAGSSSCDQFLTPNLTQGERVRLAQRAHLIIYLWNLLADPSDGTSLKFRHRLEEVHPGVEWDCSVDVLLKGRGDEGVKLIPIRRVLQLVQRIVYIDVPRSRLPHAQNEPAATSPAASSEPAKPLLDLIDVLVANPVLDKVDATSLCMLFFDAYEAHKRLARVEGELHETIVAFVVARRNLARAVRERKGPCGM